jgi:hypothetical protein
VSVDAVSSILSRGGDADDVLRDVVAVLHKDGPFSWVAISFVEGDALALGPSRGEPTAEPARFPISYDGKVVAELAVAPEGIGVEERAVLERAAELLAPYCLVGWDTGGEAWSR